MANLIANAQPTYKSDQYWEYGAGAQNALQAGAQKPGVYNNAPQNPNGAVNSYYNGQPQNTQYQNATGYVNPQTAAYNASKGMNPNGVNPLGTSTANAVGGGGFTPGGSAGGGQYSIDSLIADSIKSRDDAKKKQEDLWNKLYGQVSAIPGQYAADPLTQGSNALTQKFLSNPEALNDDTFQKIQGQNASRLRAGTDAQMRQGLGTAAASGLTDPSSISSLQERIGRGAMQDQTNSDTQLQVQRANQRNQDWMNAIQAARGGAQANIAPGLAVGNSLLQNQPNFQGNDNGGLMGMLYALSQQGKTDALQKQLDQDKQNKQNAALQYALPSMYN